MRMWFLVPLLLVVTACGSDYSAERAAEEAAAEAELSDDVDLADYEGQELGDETYTEFDERRDSYEGAYGSYAGYDCTEDCSGHEAGYQWAEENGIYDADDCGGNSWSFEEGCRSYAEENGYSEDADYEDDYGY